MLTNPGALKTRVSIEAWQSVQDGTQLREDFVPVQTVWGKLEPVKPLTYWFGQANLETGVTHRITVRRVDGLTRPEDLTGRITLVADGIRFKILHSADMEGAHRFTVVECQAVEHDYAY